MPGDRAVMKLKSIPVTIVGGTDDPDERSLDSRLAEIDENLIRGEIGPSERALLTAERKKVYEAKHPETKAGGDRKSAARSGRKVCDLKTDRFTKDTARKTGRSERAVQQDATRAKELKGDLAKTARTSLDKGAELDALKKLKKIDETVAADLVAKAQAGEEVSAAKVLAEMEEKARAAAAPKGDRGRLIRIIEKVSRPAAVHPCCPAREDAPRGSAPLL